MATTKLTKAVLDKIKAPDPSGRQVIYWDSELKGFGVLVSGTSKTKTYICQRRMPDGKTRRVTVGAVGEFAKVEADGKIPRVTGVEMARRKAGALLQGLREGVDPKAERRRAALSDKTLGAWLDLYLAFNKDLRPRSIEEYRRSAKYLEAWIDRPLREITPDMVEQKHPAIGKQAGPASANGCMRMLRAVWNFAMDRDPALPANPVRRLKKGWFELPARTGMVKAEDLPVFYAAVDALENRTAADYLKLLLFTGLDGARPLGCAGTRSTSRPGSSGSRQRGPRPTANSTCQCPIS